MKILREYFPIRNRKKRGAITTAVLLILLVLPVTLIRSQVTVTQIPVVISKVQYSIIPMSVFAPTAPKIDGIVSPEEWGAARKMQLEHGWLLFQNDATTLYLVIDLIEDTTDDPPLKNAPWGDFFYLAFDVLADEKIIPYKDLQYSIYPGTHKLGMQKYVSSSGWTGLMDTYSQLGAGFGTSMNSNTAHRIWEFAISLPEIQIGPGGRVRFGLRTYSQNPSFSDETPENYYFDFSNLLEIILVTASVDLLILAHEDFCDALKPLKAHKDFTGLSTYIQSWQNLNRSFGSEGRDEAERIKKAIAFYEKYCHTKYVMLVGDSDAFPVRYTMTDRGTPAAFDRAFYPTDLYYADLYKANGGFDNWDSNNNGYFGELHGETITGTINYDQVNLTPDIAVGRVPASTVPEVSTYVNKVISYEFGAYQSNWFKKALLIATTNWLNDACQTNEDIATSLTGYTIIKQYQVGNPCVTTPDAPTPVNINNVLNQGVGFVSYIGHGDVNEWQIPNNYYYTSHLSGLNNNDKLPVVFAAACGTAAYATLPPYDGYTDISGQDHQGTNNGEVFNNVPPQPACIQSINRECFAEAILVKYDAGAIAYMGCATGAQPSAIALDKYFFDVATKTVPPTLGYMWNSMITKYYQLQNIPNSLAQPDWTQVAAFHQPWKYHLFGDPSLRVGGIMQPIVTLTLVTQPIATLPPLTFPETPITFTKQPVATLPSVTSPGIPITFIKQPVVTLPSSTSPEVPMTLVTQPIVTLPTETSSETSKTQPVITTSDETPETSKPSGIPDVPGFGPFEAIIAILALLGYARRRSKR